MRFLDPTRLLVLITLVRLPTAENDASNLRVVFALTTINKRISQVKPVLDAIVEGQTYPPDVVYLAVPPSVKMLPTWLLHYNETSKRPGTLRILHMEADYGPASKLLAALAEGGERSPQTIIIYGDDDVICGNLVVEQHVQAQRSASVPTAFGSRKIGIGEGKRKEAVLEATGTISVRASSVPEVVFDVRDMQPACRLSDDYWISHHLVSAGVALELLPRCQYDFYQNAWPATCGVPFHTVPSIEHLDALSATVLAADGTVAGRSGGDWREQLGRYTKCQQILERRDEL